MKSQWKSLSSRRSLSGPRTINELFPALHPTIKNSQPMFPQQGTMFLLQDPARLQQLKKQLSLARSNKLDLSDQRQLISGWKSLFSKRLKRSVLNRRTEQLGCRPGYNCIKKKMNYQTKEIVYNEPSQTIAEPRLLPQEESPYFQENRQRLLTTARKIVLCYDYLKQLHYSDRKICQLIKFHCQENKDTKDILLRLVTADTAKHPKKHIQYEKDPEAILQRLSRLLARKRGFEVEQLVFSFEEFQRRLEKDVVHRGSELMASTSNQIVRREEVLKHLVGDTHKLSNHRIKNRISQIDSGGGFTERLAELQLKHGKLQHVNNLSRSIYQAMKDQSSYQQRLRSYSVNDGS